MKTTKILLTALTLTLVFFSSCNRMDKLEKRVTNVENSVSTLILSTNDLYVTLKKISDKHTGDMDTSFDEHSKMIHEFQTKFNQAHAVATDASTTATNATNLSVEVRAKAEKATGDAAKAASDAALAIVNAADAKAKAEKAVAEVAMATTNTVEAKIKADMAVAESVKAAAIADSASAMAEDARKIAEKAVAYSADAASKAESANEKAQKALDLANATKRELDASITELENAILQLQKELVVKNCVTNPDSSFTMTYLENEEEKTITFSPKSDVDKKTTVTVTENNNIYTFSIINDGITQTIQLPGLRNFITGIVIVSDSYIDNVSKATCLNVVFNTSDNEELDGVTVGSLKLIQGSTTKVSTISEIDPAELVITDIVKVSGSIANEYTITLSDFKKDYTGIHIMYGGTGAMSKVMSTAFDLDYIVIINGLYANTVQLRERHGHAGAGCSVLSSSTETYQIRPTLNLYDISTAINPQKIKSVEAMVVKLVDPNLLNNVSLDNSYYLAYDVEYANDWSELGYKGIGTKHTNGLIYDYYNGTKNDYNADKVQLAKLFASTSLSNYQEVNSDVTVSYPDNDEIMLTINPALPLGVYAVIIWVQRTDGFYSRGLGYFVK